MNPELLTQAHWDDLNRALLYLAILHLVTVTFAGSILLARAIIPSLVYTGHASEQALRVRPVLYAVTALAGVGVIVMAYLWMSNLGVLWDIYGHDYH